MLLCPAPLRGLCTPGPLTTHNPAQDTFPPGCWRHPKAPAFVSPVKPEQFGAALWQPLLSSRSWGEGARDKGCARGSQRPLPLGRMSSRLLAPGAGTARFPRRVHSLPRRLVVLAMGRQPTPHRGAASRFGIPFGVPWPSNAPSTSRAHPANHLPLPAIQHFRSRIRCSPFSATFDRFCSFQSTFNVAS